MNEMDIEYTLKYPTSLKYFAAFLSAASLIGLTLLALMHPVQTTYDEMSLYGMYTFIILFTVYSYIEFFTVEIVISSAGIQGKSGWKGKRNYLWSEISEITYSPFTMWFKIITKNKPSLRIHAWIYGIEAFQKGFIENLPEEKWISAYEKFYGAKG